MDIKKATLKDIDAILQTIEEARTIMRETGNRSQWSNGYPSRGTILNDINQQQAFIHTIDQEIVGYFCFIKGQDPDQNYKIIEQGKWLNDKPYGVIHRLASGKKVKGVAEKAFDYAFSAIDNVRVDTHHTNIPMQNFLGKNGFTHCGIIYVSDGTARDAFQKQLLKQNSK
jgi:hypothetical protein